MCPQHLESSEEKQTGRAELCKLHGATGRDEEGDERHEGQRGKQGRRREKGASWATGTGVFDRARAPPEGEKEKEINMHRKTVLPQDLLRRSF